LDNLTLSALSSGWCAREPYLHWW